MNLIYEILMGSLIGYISGALAGYVGAYYSPLARVMEKNIQESIGFTGAEYGGKIGVFTGIIGAFWVSGTIGILQNTAVLTIVLLLFCLLGGYLASFLSRTGPPLGVGFVEGATNGAWLGAMGGYTGSLLIFLMWGL